MRTLNLFDSKSNDEVKQHQERRTTRLYVLSVITAFVVLFAYTVTTVDTRVNTIFVPSREIYEELHATHPNTLECACTNIALKYGTFMSIGASYHQICSSGFISPIFYAQLSMMRADVPLFYNDFMFVGTEYFQWLTTFCTLAQLVYYNQLVAFQSNLFVNNKLLPSDVFNEQAAQLAELFISDVQYYFARGIKQLRELIGFGQPLSATFSITYKLPITHTAAGSQVRIEPIQFLSGCSCLREPTSCSDDAAFYSYNYTTQSFDVAFKLPGIHIACSSMETLLQSNLGCWYSSECYGMVR